MSWARAVIREVLGLFVDDVGFAAGIVLWLAVAGLALPRLGLPDSVPPLLLFAGLAAILIAGALRRARR